MIKHPEAQHLDFHKGVNLSELPLPILKSQTDTRNKMENFLRGVGDKVMTVAATTFLLGMLVICLPAAGMEWWEQLRSKK